MTSPSRKFPGETDAAFPERYDLRAMPPQPAQLKPGQLPEDRLRGFFTEGFLVLHDFFTKEELDACRRDVARVVDRLAETLYSAGKIKDLHREADIFTRLTLIEREYRDANVLLHKPRTKHALLEGFRALWSNERVLNLMEQILGPEVMGNPVWNLRPKVPGNEATVVPWHQDNCYTSSELYGRMVATAWVPLLDVGRQEGCLEVLPRGHLTGRVARHVGCHKDTWYLELPEDEMRRSLGVCPQDAVLCDVKYGGMVLFNNLLPHRGLPNVSPRVRWSLDLRWMAPGAGGWYGTQGVMMRSQKSPVTSIDWETFLQQNEAAGQKEAELGLDPLEPVFTSPYFDRWEMVHVNKHVIRYRQQTGRQTRH